MAGIAPILCAEIVTTLPDTASAANKDCRIPVLWVRITDLCSRGAEEQAEQGPSCLPACLLADECPEKAQLRTGGGQQSPYYEELQALQEAAETQKLGLWTTVRRRHCRRRRCRRPPPSPGT